MDTRPWVSARAHSIKCLLSQLSGIANILSNNVLVDLKETSPFPSTFDTRSKTLRVSPVR